VATRRRGWLGMELSKKKAGGTKKTGKK